MKELLEKVINEEETLISIPFTPIQQIENILESLGVNIRDCEADTNGWQVDFWYTYENKYMLSGSLHYGDFKFRKI